MTLLCVLQDALGAWRAPSDMLNGARAAAPADTRGRLTSFRGDVLARPGARCTRSLNLALRLLTLVQ